MRGVRDDSSMRRVRRVIHSLGDGQTATSTHCGEGMGMTPSLGSLSGRSTHTHTPVRRRLITMRSFSISATSLA